MFSSVHGIPAQHLKSTIITSTKTTLISVQSTSGDSISFGSQDKQIGMLVNETTPILYRYIKEAGSEGVVVGRAGDFVLGAHPEDDYQDLTISRQHARIKAGWRHLKIQNLSTQNTHLSETGVIDEAEKVTNPGLMNWWSKLKPGQKIHIGNQILMVTPIKVWSLYSTDSATHHHLFPKGIADETLNQKNTGNCYLLAGLLALAKNPYGELAIARMIKPLYFDRHRRPISWSVHFPGQKPIQIDYTDVNGQVVKGGEFKSALDGCLGWRILERAYGRLRKQKDQAIGAMAARQMTMMAVEGGFGHHAINDLTGWQPESYYFERKNLDSKHKQAAKKRLSDMLDHLGRYAKDYVVTINTPNDSEGKYLRSSNGHGGRWYMDPNYEFDCRHAYAVVGINSKKKIVNIINPHHGDKVHTLSYDQVFEMFEGLCYAKLPSNLD